MSIGLLNAIFASSSVAAGVDFPARSVVISYADTRGNEGWRPLQASEVQQMTGRAGRRGRDNVGFVVIAPSRFQNPPVIAELLSSPPDPLESKFRATYISLLNLLDAFGSFGQVRAIAEKSFAFRNTARRISRLKVKLNENIELIESLLKSSGAGITYDDVRAFERLTSTRNRLENKLPVTREEMRLRWLKHNVRTGRVIARGKGNSRFLLVLDVHDQDVTGMKENGQGVRFSLHTIKRVYDKKYLLSDPSGEDPFIETLEGRNQIISEPDYAFEREGVDEAVAILNESIENLVPKEKSEEAQQIFWECWNPVEFIQKTERDIENLRRSIWLPFENMARVLDEFGYLDFSGQKVTESGKWLADLRLDRPLLVGEALKAGVFENATPPIIAGFMASLAADADRDYGEQRLTNELLETIEDFEKSVFDVANVEIECGVEPAEEVNTSAAAVAEAWVNGTEWERLVRSTSAEEGDIVRLLSRTGEALMQIAHLKGEHEPSAKKARETAEVMLREPIR